MKKILESNIFYSVIGSFGLASIIIYFIIEYSQFHSLYALYLHVLSDQVLLHLLLLLLVPLFAFIGYLLKWRAQRIIYFSQDLQKAVEKRTRQLEEAHKRHDSYIFNVADGLRNPLQVLTGYVELMNTGGLDKDQKECFGYIKKSCNNLEEKIVFLTDKIGIERAEKAIAESEEKFRTLFDSAIDGIFLLDLKGNFIDVNRTAHERLGYTKEELLSLHINRLDTPEFAAKAPGHLAEIKENGYATFESAHLKKDGAVMPVEINSKLVDFEGQKVLFSVIRDITKRKMIENAIQKIADGITVKTGKRFFDTLVTYLAKTLEVDFAFVGRLRKDRKTIKTVSLFAKGSITKNFEYALKGTPCETVVGKEICSYSSNVQKLFPEDHLLKKMNIESYIGAPLHDTNNSPLGLLIIMDSRPFTNEQLLESTLMVYAIRVAGEMERIEKEKDLKESMEEYRLLIENANEGILIAQDAVVKYHNPKMKEITGFSKSELNGKPIAELVHPDDREMVINNYNKRIKGEDIPNIYPFRIIDKNGAEKWLEINAIKIEWEEMPASLNFFTDITERKKAIENSRFLSTISEQIANSIIATNDKFEITWVNKSFEKLYGYTPSEVIGKNPDFLNVDPFSEKIQQDISRTVSAGNVWKGEALNQRKDGIRFYCEMEIFPLFDENGNIFSYAGHQKDITYNKISEENLRKSEEKFRAVSDHSPLGIFYGNSEGKVLYLNQAAGEICGVEPKSLIGKNFLKLGFSSDDEMPKIEALFKNTLEGKSQGPTNFEIKRSDGETRFVEFYTSIFSTGSENLLMGIIRDKTGILKTEEKILELAEFNQNIVESAPVGIVTFNLQGNVTSANKAFLKIVGSPGLKETLELGMTTLEVAKIGIAEAFKKTMTTGETFEITKMPYASHWGEKLILDLKGVPQKTKEGSITGLILVVKDVTGSVRAENELRKYSIDLEEANRFKDLFIDIMHHDILNPAGIIKNAADMMAEDTGKVDLELLDMIKDNVNRQITMVEEANMLSRLNSATDLEMLNINLTNLIKNLIKDNRVLLDEAGLEVKNNVSQKFEVLASPMINQVFLNLLSNATRYAKDGGKIIIDAKNQNESILILFKDFGPGIKNEDKENIFNRFNQAGEKRVQGTGLGLAIAQRLVDLHNGKIWVEDNPDRGSIFIVELPKRGSETRNQGSLKTV